MKCIVSLLVACTLSMVTLLFAEPMENLDQGTGSLTVIVSGLSNNKGKVRIAVSDSKQNYDTKGVEPFRRVVSTITNLTAQAVFEQLPFGEYAVKVIHDENGNGKLDTNPLGIPKEDYAFSGKPAGWFGPPSWENANFRFGGNMAVKIVLRNK
jgi:uncharacterized protein (DUF2141 family)